MSRIDEDRQGRPVAGIGFAIPINEVDSPGSSRLPPVPAQPEGPTPVPVPTSTPLPTATPTPHPATFCREWEDLVNEWIREGNSYWVWAGVQFRSPFGPEVEDRLDIPSLPGLSD